MTDSRQGGRLTDSISVRLAIGFGVVLCVFGGALLANLYYLQTLKRASEEVRVRQQIRREALRAGDFAQRANKKLLEEAEFGKESFAEFDRAYAQMARTLRVLASHKMSAAEWLYLNHLAETMGRLRDVFRQTGGSRPEHPEGGGPELAQLRAAGSELVDRITRLNVRIGHHFDLWTYQLEDEATWFGELSLNVTRAIFAIALVASLLAIYVTHRAIVRPINRLVEETGRLASGDLTTRAEVPPAGEFRTLAESFNRMASALETNQRQLVETEKMASIGRLSAGIAHEINNPVAVILGYVKTMIGRTPPELATMEGLRAIEEEAQHCKSIVQSLLELARPVASKETEVVNPDELVSEVINVARLLRLADNVTIHTSVTGEAVRLPLSRSRARQIVLNIVTNALEALRQTDDRRLIVEGYVRDGPEGANHQLLQPLEVGRRFLVLRFIDNGPGIPQEHLSRLFEPFFTTKPRGTGLGLAVTYSIVKAQGGYVDVASIEGYETTFVLSLPVQETPQGSPAA